jgi:hypothetical protein
MREIKKEAETLEHNLRLYVKGTMGSDSRKRFIAEDEDRPGLVKSYNRATKKQRDEEQAQEEAWGSQSSVIRTQTTESSYNEEEESEEEVLDDSSDTSISYYD